MKKIFIIVLLFTTIVLKAQDVPFYIHTFNNLYLQNPAAAGSDEYGVIYATLQKQLIGSFADSPEQGIISGYAPIGNGKTALGGFLYQYRRSLLKTTGAMFTIAHRIDFSANHGLRVGISGGFADNFINISAVDNPSDPALLNRINNRTLMDGQVGVYYQLGNFALGASLPKLFKYFGFSNPQNPTENIYPLQNYILTASYKLAAGSQVSLQPLVLYRKYENASPSWEGNMSVYFKEQLWLAVSYRSDYGTAFIAGVRAKQRISFSYAYKLPDSKNAGYSNPAHEIQLGYIFGKKAKRLAETATPTQEEPVVVASKKTENLKDTVKNNNTLPKETTIVKKDTNTTPLQAKKEIVPVKENIRVASQGIHPLELALKYYVIVGSFVEEKNARQFIKQLQDRNKQVEVGYNSSNKRFHVYIYQTLNREEAMQSLKKVQSDSGFPEAWILKVEK
jgi:type IX secretion system PorP/SprF family membrane protein